MTTAEKNYFLLQEIEANRRFLLMAYQQNPKLLERADTRIKQLFEVCISREPDELSSRVLPLSDAENACRAAPAGDEPSETSKTEP